MGRIAYVRETLAENKLTYAWLINELKKQGINNVRPQDMSCLFGDKAVEILDASVDIVAQYLKNNG